MENSYIVELSKSYEFEGKKYEKIDLSSLENLSTNDLCRAQKMYTAKGNVAAVLETDIIYCCLVASIATGLPIEFFDLLPAKDGIKIKNRVGKYFFGLD